MSRTKSTLRVDSAERIFEPDAASADTYNELFPLYRDLYFALGRRDAEAVPLGRVLPALREIAARARTRS